MGTALSPDEPPRHPTRRSALALGALGLAATAGVIGIGGPDFPVTRPRESRERPVAVSRTALERRRVLGSAAYVYEADGKRAAYYVTDAFGARLDRWLTTWTEHTGLEPDEIRSYGAWTRGSGGSWHHSGEAFDLARLTRKGRDVVSARYDRWRGEPARQVRRRQRLYWRLAASLHTEFADVVTYLYDAAHADHIHVDTGRFGPTGAPRLIERSGVQVQAVQAMCRHVWGRTDVQINGEFDRVTRHATATILREHGGEGGLDAELGDGVQAWRAFMLATVSHA
ncbi:MAG: hypothetical protein L0H25_08230 [Micrococcales bacterium]|nr:hypothetical protein [Micrococcales bacterium]